MLLTSEAIADYALELSYEDLSEEAVAAAKRLVLDSVGCCLGAYASPPSKHLRAVYGDRGGADGATVFGDGSTTAVEYAGLINSAMVRYLDYNDTYISEGRACHPSDHIPALVSVAESEGRTGKELIAAIALAYEVEGLGLDTGVAYGHGYDYVTWGSYSTAATVGKLMGLSREELVNALGIAGASNLSLMISRKGEVSMWKGVAHPYVTHNGIQACQMARAGMTGPEAVFEGENGFFEVAAGEELTIDRLGGRDGAAYRITDAHIKPFPCGYYMMPMIAGVQELVTEHDVDAPDVESIDIETFATAADILAGEEKWSKELTRESADHSIPYTASIAVLYGDVTPEHYRERYRRSEDVHRLMDTVSVTASEELTADAHEEPDSTPAVVRLVVDGETHETRVDYAPGHARNPLSRDDLEGKLREMAEPLLTDEQIEAVVRTSDRLEAESSVEDLVGALSV
ncbi:MAG: MmgE/PrpD family protein [Haloferacaceae archaeon]